MNEPGNYFEAGNGRCVFLHSGNILKSTNKGRMYMDVKIYDVQYDEVIKSFYLTTGVDYGYALKKLVPLINKLDFQRNPLRGSFYKRLEEDIQGGCIMPNITVAIKAEDKIPSREDITEEYIDSCLDNAFILDGIQRLSTLSRVDKSKLNLQRTLYCNK